MSRHTCIAPTPSQRIGKANNIGAEHDTGPELARHKCCQGPTNEEPGDDVGRGCVHSSNAEDEGSSPHQDKGVSCSVTTQVSAKISFGIEPRLSSRRLDKCR